MNLGPYRRVTCDRCGGDGFIPNHTFWSQAVFNQYALHTNPAHCRRVIAWREANKPPQRIPEKPAEATT